MNLYNHHPRKKERKEGTASAKANKVCFTMWKYQYIGIKWVEKRKKCLTVTVLKIKVIIIHSKYLPNSDWLKAHA